MSGASPAPQGQDESHEASAAASPWKAVFAFWAAAFALALAVLALERVALWTLLRPSPEHGGAASDLLAALVFGLRFDAAGLAYPFAVAILATPLVARLLRRRGGERVAVAVLLTLTAFIAVADLHFFTEFRTRLNFVAIEYLDDPATLLDVVVGQLGWPLFLGSLALAAGIGFTALRGAGRLQRRFLEPVRATLRWFHLLPLLLTLLLLARGGFGRRPLRPQDADHSAHRFANELTLSGPFTLERHLYEAIRDPDATRPYGTSGDEALALVRGALDDGGRLVNDTHPLLRLSQAGPARARNVVIVILESFAARWVGALGARQGERLTPSFDRLAEDGLLFDRFYSNGPSTNRSLPALLGGLPCLPGRLSLTKSAAGRQPFLTFGSALAALRVETTFLTGGASSWENLGGWCAGQGFTRVVDREDFDDAVCVSSFGPPDHVLLDRALAIGDALGATPRPFGLVVLTATNHPPFALPDPLPDGAAEAVEPGGDDGRRRAMRYADWAVARFVTEARSRPWGRKTLFVLVGDHGMHGEAPTDIDLERRHVPLLLLGSGVEPGRSSLLGSHVDVLPTVLEHLGRPVQHAAWGRSLLRAPPAPRFVVFGPHGGVRLHGILDDTGHLLVDRPDRPGELFRVAEDRVTLERTVQPEVLEHLTVLGRSYLGCFGDALRRRTAGAVER